MNEETKYALEQSIEKWKSNAAAESMDNFKIGVDHCPLCDLFFENAFCGGCPVSAFAGKPNCIGTPWRDVVFAEAKWEQDAGKLARAHANRMVIFLKRLRE